jgi:SulP family sulfate permease
VPLTKTERAILDKANGKVLFFYLSGPMIFSVSKAISRQHASIGDYDVMILDLSDVPMIDVTVGLALENAIKDALDANCEVLLLCPNTDTRERLEKLNVLNLIPNDNHCTSREQALQSALEHVAR